MPFFLIANELTLPCRRIIVVLRMTLKKNYILNLYESTQYDNYKNRQNFHKELSLGSLFPIQKKEERSI